MDALITLALLAVLLAAACLVQLVLWTGYRVAAALVDLRTITQRVASSA